MRLFVKINDISDKEFKYGVDMRYVDQIDGKDLDPFNGKSKPVDNHWYRGMFAKHQPKDDPAEAAPAASSATEQKSGEKSGEKRKAEGGGSDDSDAASSVSSSV